MILNFNKEKTKDELLQDPRIQHYKTIGDSIHFLRRRNALVKIGLYIGRFSSLTAKDVVFLNLAKTKCDILIVGIESDYSVRVKKEHSLVPAPAKERAFLLSSISCVDWIYLYDEEFPELSISTIAPDFIFYGLYSDDDSDVKSLTDRLTKIEHPFELEEKPKKKIPLKFFDIPTES